MLCIDELYNNNILYIFDIFRTGQFSFLAIAKAILM